MKYFLIPLLCCLCLYSPAQNVINVNGTNITAAANQTEKKVVDHATLKCYYAFSKKKEGQHTPYRTDTLVLAIGGKVSRFYDPARLGRDSLIKAKLKNLGTENVKSISVYKSDKSRDLSGMQGTIGSNTNEGESYQIYKDRSAGKITVIDNIAGQDSYQYEDEAASLSWKITGAADSILSYACQKATVHFRGRDYTAWFAPDVPVSEGPWKFMGLPGLILKVEDDKQLYSFSLVGLQQLGIPQDILMDDVKKNIKCTRAEFEKQKKKQSSGMQLNLNAGNVIISEIPGKFDYLPMEID